MLYEEDRYRSRTNEIGYSSSDLHSTSSAAPSRSPSMQIDYRPSIQAHRDYPSRYQSDTYPKPPFPYSGQYPISTDGFSPIAPVYTEPHFQNVLDSHINNSLPAFAPARIDTRAQFPLSPRRDSHSLGVSIPYMLNHTQSTASTSHSWPSTEGGTTDADLPKKKPRREKPKIALAPDQPPTTQGRPRARVYVACIQCRNRKIRCDGVKPICYNCARKSNGGHDCNYDAAPRRRGPDKTPGARQRMARESQQDLDSSGIRRRRKPRETSPSRASETTPQTSQINNVAPPFYVNRLLSPEASSNQSMSPSYSASSTSFPSPLSDPPVYGGCSCHGLVHCPISQPYVSTRKQSLPFFDLLPAPGHTQLEQLSNTVEHGGAATRGWTLNIDDYSDESDNVTDIANEPSLRFSRKVWYEALCSLYASADTSNANRITHTDRAAISRSIARDLGFLFRASNYWFSFFHVPSFFGQFFDPVRRDTMQPSLILAALALSAFWQSSEIEQGRKGRIRALRLREEAQSVLEASFNAGSIDETLAQAAWLLALFEVCAHPDHSTSRSVSAIVMLDSIIRCLALTVLDAYDPNTSVFAAGQVPSINVRSSDGNVYIPHHERNASTSSGCSCLSRTLGKYWSKCVEHAPLWATTPAWDPTWSEAEIRKEASRRLCWAAISLAAGHVSYASANDSHIPDLHIADPSNFALLFSGESITSSLSLSPSAAKDTVWALYDRSFVLWHICARVRADTSMGDVEKGKFAVKAWLETDVIETALNKHTCAIEKAYIFQGREYLFNTRMCISFDFQRYIPLVNSGVSGIFHRTKAKEWLTHQAIVAERFMHGLHTITGNSNNLLARRPFFVFWFMSQVLRSLRLWHCDNSLIIALDVCKAFLPAIDYLSALWPCEEQRQRYMRLRERLDSACHIAGISTPPPANFALPDPSSRIL
ncbi:MAG: hypothetical protein NXY57DRAFT_1021362 [Lentinula lateritia]|uniref:Zn(2)-C6 fungal-type domain-containing protein n=1 Tax=Lentinula lateritia TaxID=40482 RepID=A0ABQ8V4M8_9AGAR|nr:MAG: hypothetical protein NXY57DRAFT_1021362 [Lentinula lateritia]KAJ4472372.1 hypothetical protein C8R41DRAFT_850051 [Lentinula lateritia]